ncbi:MAG: hypothetical protein KZQ70_13735 [gamma proteobacterium symbiont of Lucinoma myriamae]|nr:hypothetical protein [gamma proteobacterium symbiont of Lucinoma myriamae]MCU7819629.1 hypothetical protein [gamma proteobacterium symbiont of Lucinoma myriamae]
MVNGCLQLSLSLAQIKQLLTIYKLGTIISYAGITDGIENINYHVKTSIGNYVVTNFEHSLNLNKTKSRLSDQQASRQQFDKQAELTLDKDPDVLKYLLLKHRENSNFNQ